ncbi:DEAD/DEAH box helicase [Ramlibacter sp. RBP-2]|uniref:DEAD/DEAH box helicase n=1 Tax=Ramlibacter lithotrophicus TaxID=2606681 RepID=A0A7X6I6X3_9BURK|nr:DEAD/DEAH box helicase [Ramlibacter lithotrophicus]NKE66863.1 DEAD/DEAH box helicase [Ramlibacter lithotrophicus]
MVDFAKLRTTAPKPKSTDPVEIFRRLPKPAGINDLYTSQAEVLQQWYPRRGDKDIVLKLHTGGGKTLVGLLMAQSTINETSEPVLFLAPTTQLVNQTLEKAKGLGIPAVPYERKKPLNDAFVNGSAIMVATYKALFNGQSKFKVRGNGQAQKVGAIILDDAHTAFSEVRDAFTLEVSSQADRERYQTLTGLFRNAFKDSDRLGTFDDVLSGEDFAILEVPYWAWFEQLGAVQEILKGAGRDTYAFSWPLLRDNLHLCHALISRSAFTVTPILPLVDLFPTFVEAPRRIYMSATIADDSEIIRTFDANRESVRNALSSRSLAGISERMILIPDLMPFAFKVRDVNAKLLKWASGDKGRGAILLAPSDKAASQWADVGSVAIGSEAVEKCVLALQQRATNGPVIFSNRYDGIDLPGDSCRLLVMSGLPAGTSNYEFFRASALYGGASITRMLAQRIEQGIGRGARGAGDHCVVILSGSDLAAWIAKDANFRFLTSATRAQMKMGSVVSEAIENVDDIFRTIERSLDRDSDWVEYHAETLAELVEDDKPDETGYHLASAERKAFNNWRDGHPEQAIAKLTKVLDEVAGVDLQSKGWLVQFAARIAAKWGNSERAEELQQDAYAKNRNLLRPKIQPPYRQLRSPGRQATAIAAQIGSYRIRKGFMQTFEQVTSNLHGGASANQFEQALSELGKMVGLSAERHDIGGVGPDVLWLLPDMTGLVIEAKSRKDKKNAFTKEQHGQLLVAAEWFGKNYPGYRAIRVSVHPTNVATEPAAADSSYVLTYDRLQAMVGDARALLVRLCESQLKPSDLETECAQLLDTSPIRADRLPASYLQPFVVKAE